ncbi:tRNA (adenosine(37)-N6)-threonylcarbamoyltransferase complex ATPase subunit type 1 TsaE [Sneathiella limimaris]|uniref:tRNA (adenosine(37)-N6)-threonylcarbamoyltransferase complex ATPase subunit type 1 TsaE n=1 Tax=Sneathiella limimaris TaxID=1964213 RepID=UPI00146F23FB|nr:tRNA (adenosine(37)-N6)-threonylcarbamoyltransferase complex ATPase subunit type 1 TsaE [Sneathiella limimaris]
MSTELILSHTVTSEQETAAFAKELAAYLKTKDVVFLKGTLGAGKTSFARALIRALCGGDIEVPSPTFNLLLTYEGTNGPIYHYDFYRLEDPEEVWELDVEDAYESAITLMEWVERLEDLAPQNALEVDIELNEDVNSRTIRLRGNANWKMRLQELVGRQTA